VKATATLRLGFDSNEQSRIVLTSLKPETQTPSTQRARITLRKQGKFIVLTAEARDTVALRASLNAYLRWINALLNVLEVLKTH
jgi:tRNA threonylcarbamoyladenosine modification (KEOPS) complex  Pcc1 subunit